MDFKDKVKELAKVIPFRFRVGSGAGAYKEENWKKIYSKYQVMAYIDSRDAMDRLDELFGHEWQRDHYEVWMKSYCRVSLRDWEKWIGRSDVWEITKVAKEKWEASDAFKRACVNRWLGRFLYSMPLFYITADEVKANMYNITKFVKTKNKDTLLNWANEYNLKQETLLNNSKYESNDEWWDGSENLWDDDQMSEIQKRFKAPKK